MLKVKIMKHEVGQTPLDAPWTDRRYGGNNDVESMLICQEFETLFEL